MERKATPLKKFSYLALSAFLGILLATVIHAIIEIFVIKLLILNFERFGLGLSWNDWIFIHNAGSAILWIFGFAGGIYFGSYWWQTIYVEHNYPWRKQKYRWLAKYFD